MMEFKFHGNKITFERTLSKLDKLVLRFVKILNQQQVDYVIISGYIAILFGRSRQTEDVDLFIGEMPLKQFVLLWKALDNNGFECINVSTPQEAYADYSKKETAIRFAAKGTFIPNFELKYPKTDLNEYSLKNKIVVELNGEKLNTSELELQIAYKLYLGSEKDIEDAIHLWKIFKTRLNQKVFNGFAKRLEVEDRVKELE